MGLNDSYSAVRGQILLMNALPSIRQAYSSVSQEEKQRLLSSTSAATDSTSSAAMAVRGNNSGSKSTPVRFERFDSSYGSQDFRSQEKSTKKFSGGRQDRRRAGSGRGRPNCSHCGELGHWIQTCYELYGYPVGHPKAKHNSGPKRFNKPAVNHVSETISKVDGNHLVGISEAQLQQLLSLLDTKIEGSSTQANVVTKPGLSKITSRNWIIDSGATDHIASSSESFFYNNKKCSLPPILLPSGEKASITAKGSLPLNSVYYLHDVLHPISTVHRPSGPIPLMAHDFNYPFSPDPLTSLPTSSPHDISTPTTPSLSPSSSSNPQPTPATSPPPTSPSPRLTVSPLSESSDRGDISSLPIPPSPSSPSPDSALLPDPSLSSHVSSPADEPDPVPLRRSSRQSGPPVKLSDYDRPD
ncbi:hypothetical protein JRO89_XS05G0245100 [Xanthoceras sorbifolium]|uniref:CCHC-type domain-containing protein n=1 Tax=Xanthoceras sorbifolium TaxID=99658 RepID=A0ABQ8I343_9ROSI|nr:hypothetical protein JRO89_XS05G0245100 [Xanthoceras sorbifolium]